MSYHATKDQRAALVHQIAQLEMQLADLQPQYDAEYVAHLLDTGEDGHMTAGQVALYTGLTTGRVRNMWSLGNLLFDGVQGKRMSLRSDVDLMMKNRWKRA